MIDMKYQIVKFTIEGFAVTNTQNNSILYFNQYGVSAGVSLAKMLPDQAGV